MSDGEPADQQGPIIHIDTSQLGGVWANFARVSHSPYEFTLDFVRLDYSSQPPQGIVVARVSLSPLLVTQLIDALSTNWAIYAERTMPPEVQGEFRDPDDEDRGGSAASGSRP
jgi:hypothetical protein